jgi:hypothetical protein
MIQTWVVFMFISLLTGYYVDDNYVMVIILDALVKMCWIMLVYKIYLAKFHYNYVSKA